MITKNSILIIRKIAFFAIIILLFPRALLRVGYMAYDAYPRTYQDAKMLHEIRIQKEMYGVVDLRKATSFEWDTIYYFNDLLFDEDVKALRPFINGSLYNVRRMRLGKFDFPMGQCMIFVKDGRFIADFIMPANYGIKIPVYYGGDDLRGHEMAVLTAEEARFVLDEDGALRLEGVAYD